MTLICAWCGSTGEVIGDGKSLPGLKAVKCTKCHHEWLAVVQKSCPVHRHELGVAFFKPV